MTNKKNQPLIAGLDIGSTKVTIVIGSVNQDADLSHKIEIVGIGSAPSLGIKQGVVVNIEATTEAIRRAREEAELMAGSQITEVWVGVNGTHIKSFDSKGIVAIKTKEVSESDVERVIEAAKAVAVPPDRQVLHVLPREYRVDGQEGILDPVGMAGIRLEASVHIVTASRTALANYEKCIEKSGITVSGLILDPLASATSVLLPDEKTLGVALADIGGGHTNLIYFVNGSVAHISFIPVGGNHFTQDIAVGLRTPQMAAEALKKKYGCALATLISENDSIEVEGVGGRKARSILRRDLAEVIEPRAEELLQLIHNDLRLSGLLPLLGSGVVLTGGGSQLEGLIEMGEFVFDIPVRKGIPGSVGGMAEIVKSAASASAVGLLLYGLQSKAPPQPGLDLHQVGAEWAEKFKKLLSDFF